MAMRALLVTFALANMAETEQEVRESGGAVLADRLGEVLAQLQTEAPLGGAAEEMRAAGWDKLSSPGGFPTVGWREAYVFALMVLGVGEVEAWEGVAEKGGKEEVGALQRAMKHLDMALIMGGG
ncbi:hypothetical protein T484DRAFT_1787703 [Baffinella frigidus]|nr:hypothetical protein T484DRAFT_1787703 [Cryptophyta sp. CCMP2293]